MSATVIVNGQTVVHKDSGGVLTTGPDVCLTPMGPSVVPIPYTNIATSADTSQGSTSVAMDSNPIMLKGSVFSKSTGDEPGKVGGVASGVTKGKAKFVNYSSDVFADGKPVCRRLDPMVSNLSAAGNTPPAPLQQGNTRTRGKQAQGHLLSIVLVFEHPDVVTGRTTQPLVDLKYSLNGPRTVTVTKSDPYTGIQEYVPQGGYTLEFDRNDLKEKLAERPINEKRSPNGAAFGNHKAH